MVHFHIDFLVSTLFYILLYHTRRDKMTETEIHRTRLRIAKRIVRTTRNTSTSYLQRTMEIGYNYADKLMEDISKLHGFRFVRKARRS